jgi:hypothetical protein
MHTNTIYWPQRARNQRTGSFAIPHTASRKVCQMVSLFGKIFTAGVPALALMTVIAWGVTSPEINSIVQSFSWIKDIAVLASVPSSVWIFATIFRMKERGWA